MNLLFYGSNVKLKFLIFWRCKMFKCTACSVVNEPWHISKFKGSLQIPRCEWLTQNWCQARDGKRNNELYTKYYVIQFVASSNHYKSFILSSESVWSIYLGASFLINTFEGCGTWSFPILLVKRCSCKPAFPWGAWFWTWNPPDMTIRGKDIRLFGIVHHEASD